MRNVRLARTCREEMRSQSLSLATLLRLTLAMAVLAGSVGFAPIAAEASRLSSDRIGGIKLSSGRFPTSSTPDISARSGALVAQGGRILWTRQSQSRRAMASTTKVMTALLVLERCRLDETVKITSAAARTPYGTGLRSGEKRSVRKLLQLMLVCSSNDAATALAIHVGGSVKGFSKLMNSRAKQLGLDNTRFVNPHGLDARGHYSTAMDLTTLMRAAVQKPEFKRIIKLKSVVLPAYRGRKSRRIKTTVALLGHVDGLRGGKTGFTNDARYSFVANARRDGMSLTSVVLGSPSSSARFTSSKRLLEWGFKHYRNRKVCSATQIAGTVPVSTNPGVTVLARYAKTTSVPLFDLMGPVAHEASLLPSVAVPVFAGQKLGVVRIIQAGTVIAAVSAVARAHQSSAEETVGIVAVTGSRSVSVVARAAASTASVAAYDTTRPVTRRIDLVPNVEAPVSLGQPLGKITYTQNGRVLVVVPAVAAQSID